jgi:hypothetical protein
VKTANLLIRTTALLALSTANYQLSTCSVLAFEGRISAALTRGSDTQTFVYTVSSNALRIERGETNCPYAADIVELGTGETTLLFPQNRTFAHRKPPAENDAGLTAQTPMVPPLDGSIGPTNLPPGAPPILQMPQLPSMPRMPAGVEGGISGGMPVMPMMMPPMGMAKLELKSTGERTNLLGFACEKYELRQRSEVMEIWATDQLVPFQPWQTFQPHRFGGNSMEECWTALLKAKKLFPLQAILGVETLSPPDASASRPKGQERMRFQVKSIAPGGLEPTNAALFQPPSDYREVTPLTF